VSNFLGGSAEEGMLASEILASLLVSRAEQPLSGVMLHHPFLLLLLLFLLLVLVLLLFFWL